MSGTSDQRGWEIAGLGMLSARPTVRLSGSMSHPAGAPPGYGFSRDSSKKGKMPALTENVTKRDRRRVADLADNLDATDLRAVLERDMRRRDKKRSVEYDKLERSLKKRAEKQRREEERRVQRPLSAPTAVHPAFRKEVDNGLEQETSIGQTPPSPTSLYADDEPTNRKAATWLNYGPDRSQDPFEDQPEPSQDPFEDPAQTSFEGNARDQSLTRIDTASPRPIPAATPMEDPIIGTAEEVRMSQARLSEASMSPPLSPVRQKRDDNLSPLRRELTPDLVAATKPTVPLRAQHRASDPAPKKPGTWAQFFRRGGPSPTRAVDEPLSPPPEMSFSNTSRESMSRQPIPAHLVGTVAQRRSNTPVRKQSIFREDLPESPVSPPDSRVQSPDVTLAAADAATARRNRGAGSSSGHIVLGRATPDLANLQRTDSPAEQEKDGPASALPMSTSLASVGSEGSWLTGRPSQRKGSHDQVHDHKPSFARPQGEFTGSFENLGMPEEEYFRRLTSNPDAVESPHDSKLQAHETEDANLVRRDTNRRKPTLVHRDPHVKSREGLLAEFQSAEIDDGASRPGTATGSDDGQIGDLGIVTGQKVEYGQGHARQLSSGSARILHISHGRNRSGKSTPDFRQSQVDTSTDTNLTSSSRL